jgi:hypothetical protein
MAISAVGSAAAAANTVTMPTQQIDDLLMVFAFNNSSTTVPTVPVGWKSTNSSGGGTTLCAFTLGYKWAATASEVTGTWTGATDVVVVVYRGVQRMLTTTYDAANNATITYAAQTLEYTNSTSWGVRFVGHRTATNVNSGTPSTTPSTLRNGTLSSVVAFDSNSTLSANITAGTQSVNASSGWVSVTVELIGGDTGKPTRDLYIPDYYSTNTTAYVQKLSTLGVQSILPFTGFGHSLNAVVDVNGNVYTGDAINNVVSVLAPNGTESNVAFTSQGAPYGIAIDIAGSVYTTDTTNGNVKKMTKAGGQSTLGFGTVNTTLPNSLAVDKNYTVYLGENGAKTVRTITQPGGTLTTLTFSTTALQSVFGIALDSANNLYVVDNVAGVVYKRTPAGAQTTVGFTRLSTTAVGGPVGVAVDGVGTIYASDFGKKAVYMLSGGVESALALTGVVPRFLSVQPYSTNDFFQFIDKR